MPLRPAPKPIRRVVSKPLRNSARGRHCTLRLMWCEMHPDTVVLAHLRGVWALAVGAKPHDFFGVYACGTCHKLEEQSGYCSDHDRLRALYETQSLMLEAGLIVVKGDG
jgi:hypothetical protein